MLKKFTALLLTLCIMFCMSACDLNVDTSISKPEKTSSLTETSTQTLPDNDDIFYDDSEVETSSEFVPQISEPETTTTTSTPPSSSKKSYSSKISTSSKKATPSKVTPPENDETEYMVWIPTNGGKKYHTRSSCSNMKNPEQVSEATAEARGFGPCKRCH